MMTTETVQPPIIIELDRTPTANEEVKQFLNPDEERKCIENQQLQRNIDLQREYAKTSKCLAWTWAVFSMVVTALQFCKPYGRHLEQAEFIAIVATALATVIGLYVQVGKGMFGK